MEFLDTALRELMSTTVQTGLVLLGTQNVPTGFSACLEALFVIES